MTDMVTGSDHEGFHCKSARMRNLFTGNDAIKRDPVGLPLD